MPKPDIAYQLHDSVIASVSTGPRREAALVIDLYPIFYPDKPRIELRFSGILNHEKVQSYVQKIEKDADGEYIGCRIDSFSYDVKKESKDSDYWFFLETSWNGPMWIHCSKMTMTKLSNPDNETNHDGNLQ